MSYRQETTQVSAQFVNNAFMRKLDDGRIKEAAVEGTAFIREKVRQESFAREIIVPVPLQDDEIDRDERTDEPKKIIEKEPQSVATFVPITGSGPRVWFRGERYAVKFGKIESQRFTKSKFQLMTYQNDIRKILSDNSVKDMADQEDIKFLKTVDDIIKLNPAQKTPGVAFNSTAFKKGMQAMAARRRPIGKFFMAKELFYEALDLPATSVGNEIAVGHFREGIEHTEKLFGIPVVSTAKGDLIASVTGSARNAYIFSPENYLGNFFLLQDATLFIKTEADLVSFFSYEMLGMGFGNRLSMQCISF